MQMTVFFLINEKSVAELIQTFKHISLFRDEISYLKVLKGVYVLLCGIQCFKLETKTKPLKH